MKKIITAKYWLTIFTVSGAVFVWGLGTWITARFYQPSVPVQGRVPTYTYRVPELERSVQTDSLPGDRLFFGGAAVENSATVSTAVSFHSSLILWGTIKGETAVVGLDPNSSAATKLVRVGEVYAGEKIVLIGSDYIVVRNQTGTGRVNL